MLEKLWFMAVGMATLAYSGQLRDATNHAVLNALMQAGGVLIPDTLARLKEDKG